MISQKINGSTHLYNNSDYAHFSQITEHNKDIFPLYSKAHPIKYVLNKGESIIIPAGWWHWIKSYGERCISVNFFHTNEISVESIPVKLYDVTNGWKAFENWTDEYLIDKIDKTIPTGLIIWIDQSANQTPISMKEFITNYKGSNKFAYLLSAKDFDPEVQNNSKILDALQGDFNIPLGLENVNSNFWMNFGNIDSGLHYDDKNSMICVIDGYKEIILYPPSDSIYLYPYPLNPIVLEPFKQKFQCNLYKDGPKLNVEITSAQILEFTLKQAPNVAKLALALQQHYGVGRIVYGIKNTNDIIQWEFYFYGVSRLLDDPNVEPSDVSELYIYSNPDFQINEFLKVHYKYFPEDINKYKLTTEQYKKLAIISIDLTEESVMKGITPCLNLYYALQPKLTIPFRVGELTYKKNEPVKSRSIQYIDYYHNIMTKFNGFKFGCQQVGILDDDVTNLINFLNGSKYICSVVAFINKGEEIGLYMLGINLDAFLGFLAKYNYHAGLISYLIKHKHDTQQFDYEVGFHFLKGNKNSTPSRTAFYGIF